MTTRAGLLLLALASLAHANEPGAASRAQGDAAWARRAEGWPTTRQPAADRVAEALAAYEQAHALAPSDPAARFALMEALWYQGWFVEHDARRRRAVFERLETLAGDTVLVVEARVPGAARLEPEARGKAFAGDQDAARAHFWAAIAGGLWGMSHSKMSSGFHGVAPRIRDHATTLVAIDPAFADGGGLRLLGRLHAKTPRVRMFTGWIDPLRGVELLERARAASDADPRNAFFLAEALIDHVPERRAEGLALLRAVAVREPAAGQLVEQAETIDAARELLARLETVTP